MYNKKLTPEESIEKIKLMMKYDTSKTLNENVETVKQPLNEVSPLIAVIPWLTSKIGSKIALAGVGTWIYNIQGGGDAFIKAKTVFQGCSSLDARLKPTQDKGAHREAADKIYNAVQGVGTKEADVKAAISSMATVADLCAMYKYYNKTYGDLYDDLDGDFDGESFRQYVWSAMSPIVDDAEADLAKSGNTKTSGSSGSGGAQPTIPTELKDTEGVKKFQDWADTNKAGWATGFKEGKLNRGPGYGRFGPRTSKAWNQYKNEYLGGKSPAENDPSSDIDTGNEAGTEKF